MKPGDQLNEPDGSSILILEIDGDLIRIRNKHGKPWVTRKMVNVEDCFGLRYRWVMRSIRGPAAKD